MSLVWPRAAAADVFTELASPASAARIQVAVADAALDLAELAADGNADRATALTRARAHTLLALRLAREVHDEPGEGLALLTRVRVQRLSGYEGNRVAQIERVANRANKLHDHALVSQAFTALGDELAARDERAAARDRYRQAIGLLDGADLPALTVHARRALLLDEEMGFGPHL